MLQVKLKQECSVKKIAIKEVGRGAHEQEVNGWMDNMNKEEDIKKEKGQNEQKEDVSQEKREEVKKEEEM